MAAIPDSKLYSVCVPCDEIKPLDGKRHMMDFDLCEKCGGAMSVWTKTAVQQALMNQTIADAGIG